MGKSTDQRSGDSTFGFNFADGKPQRPSTPGSTLQQRMHAAMLKQATKQREMYLGVCGCVCVCICGCECACVYLCACVSFKFTCMSLLVPRFLFGTMVILERNYFLRNFYSNSII